MRVDAEERGIVAQFFAMLKDKSWSHASSADGTDVFKLPGERIHRIMGVTRTDATPEEVLTFFSDPRNFDEHFKILDAMFKSGSVVKIGGAGWTEAPEILSEESAEINGARNRNARNPPRVGNFAALSVGGDDEGNLKASVSGMLGRLRVSELGAKIEEAFSKVKKSEKEGKQKGTLFGADDVSAPMSRVANLPSAQSNATRDALARMEPFSSSGPDDLDSDDITKESVSELIASVETRVLKFVDRPGHALLHGTFKLPSVVPDRDFVWDQVALRLPTGSVLIAGKSVEEFDDDEVVPVSKGHVRGAVLTSGYYIAPETEAEGGGSKIAFVVQADPKGSLPAWVVNFVAPKQAHNVTRLRKFLDGR
jgi:hypothetical protein